MHGIYVSYNISEENSTEQWPKTIDAFAYVQRDKKQSNNSTVLTMDELRSHAVRYIKSLKENANSHLVEHRIGEIEHFNKRQVEAVKSKAQIEGKLVNLEEMRELIQTMSGLNLLHDFAGNAGKLIRQLGTYVIEQGHSTSFRARSEYRLFKEIMGQIDAVYARILCLQNPMTEEFKRSEKLWYTVCEQSLDKIEAKIERLAVSKKLQDKKIKELDRLKLQNAHAKDRLDHAVLELNQILEVLEP